MIVRHSDVLNWLRQFCEGRKLNGYNTLGAWWDDRKGSTHLVEWSEIEEWVKQRDIYEHCRVDVEAEDGERAAAEQQEEEDS